MGEHRLLGFYTRDGVEFGLYAYGILGQLRRLGYRDINVVLQPHANGDQVVVRGDDGAGPQTLVELIVERRRVARLPEHLLFVHWLPLATLTRAVAKDRVLLDGQPYSWEADDMVSLFDRPCGPPWPTPVTAERDGRRFALRDDDTEPADD